MNPVQSPEMANKDVQIKVRVDAETKAALEKAAESEDRSLSSFILWLFKEWQKKQK